MAGFGGIGFCCCDGPCPCAVSDDFAVDSIADYDVTGTFAVAGGVLTATTAGTATQSLKLPSGTRAAGVKADVIDDSHALFGLVIGSGDNRIEWLWDVANTQCTLLVYSEGVAIVDEDYAGDPTTTLEVQIVANDCSWDVAVYRDGTLLDTHTAVAVTFDADAVPFGVAADGSGGTWDNLCLRACDQPCRQQCNTIKHATTYRIEVAEGSNSDCDPFAGNFLLGGHYTPILTNRPLAGCEEITSLQWTPTTSGTCGLISARESDGGFQENRCGVETVGLEWGWPAYATVPSPSLDEGAAWTLGFAEDPLMPGTAVATLTRNDYDDGLGTTVASELVYTQDGLPLDLTGEVLTLTAASDPVCGMPLTITATPITSTDDVAFDSRCNPQGVCVPLYSEHGLLSLDGSIGGDDFRVCLSGPAGYSNGPFTGVINGATQGMTGDCATATIAVSLECKRVCEHRYAWVLSLDDGTNTAEIEYEPAAAPTVGDVISGPVTLCGGTQAFAALLSDFTGLVEDHPFSCACGEVDPALVCEVSDVLRVRGESDGTLCVPSSCTSTPGTLDLTQGEILCSGTPISASGFDDEKPYFRGPLPVNDSFGTFDGFEIVLYCDGSALQALMLDATNCIVDAGIVSIDCESLTGTIDFTNLNTACCASGSFKVHFG